MLAWPFQGLPKQALHTGTQHATNRDSEMNKGKRVELWVAKNSNFYSELDPSSMETEAVKEAGEKGIGKGGGRYLAHRGLPQYLHLLVTFLDLPLGFFQGCLQWPKPCCSLYVQDGLLLGRTQLEISSWS